MRQIFLNLTIALLVIGLTACSKPAQQDPVSMRVAPKKADIEFTVTNAGGLKALKPQGNQSCTGDGPKDGCVLFDRGEAGIITFGIKNGKKDALCDDRPPQPQWVIRQIRLTSSGDLATGKGDFTVPQPQWLQDSFPQVNLKTGVVYSAGVNSATSSAVVVNFNSHAGEQFIFYEVTASDCDNSEFPRTDPRIQNKGA